MTGRGDNEPLWTADDVVAYLNVSKSWVEHAAPRGLIPSVRIGRMRRFVPAQIRAFAVGDSSERVKGSKGR